MAEDVGYRLTKSAIAVLVLIHVVYVSFIASRAFCAERNHWETWTLYPLSYLWSVGMCVICIRECCLSHLPLPPHRHRPS